MANVSFSQYSMWASCPHHWKLSYKDGLSSFTESIHTLFGSAMHFVLQEYLTVMYSKTIVEADKLDLNTMLKDKMRELYLSSKQNENFTEFTNVTDMANFYNDGIQILEFFKKNRGDYFSKKGYELVGVEVPLEVNLKLNINFVAYLDVVIRDVISNDIYIYDFKTSTMGWKDAAKKDEIKTSQLILYKNYYSKQYNIPIDKIHVQFIILKRKLYENTQFTQKRFQKFEPASGKVTLKKIISNFENFVNSCYDENGNFLDKEHHTNASKKTCMYCEFNKTKHCNGV